MFDTERSFTGQIFDAGTGLGFYNARYYDTALGKFISPDSIVPNPTNPGLFNRFAYVSNNPLRFTDPTGFQCLDAGLTDYDGDSACGRYGSDIDAGECEDPRGICPVHNPGPADFDPVVDIEYEVEWWAVSDNPVVDATTGKRLFPTDESSVRVRVFPVWDNTCSGLAHCLVARGRSFAPPGNHINMLKRDLGDVGDIVHEIFHHVEQGTWPGLEIDWIAEYIYEDQTKGYANNEFENRARDAETLVDNGLNVNFKWDFVFIPKD